MANFDATSGSYTTRLTVTQTSQDVASNTSVLTYSLTLIKNSGYGLWNNDSCPWSITINGTTVSGTFTYDFRNYSSLTLKGNTNISAPHNSDGTKTVACSASVDMNNSSYVSVMSPSGTLTLDTIPRASAVSIPSSYSITNTTGSLTYTVTSHANFYHKVEWALGGVTTSATLGQINNTSRSFTIANTALLDKLPTSTAGGLGIAVYTYSDSGYTNQIGATTASSAISINTSNIKPSVSLGNISINSTPISGYAVAGYASLKDTYTTTNSRGASGVTTYFTISTGSMQTTSTTSTSGTIYTNTVPQSNSNYTITIYSYAKDSRGAVSDTVSKSFGVWGYTPPTATLSAYRVADSTSTTEDGTGNYVYVTFAGAVTVSIDGQNTIQSVVCTYSGDISGTATSGQHIALADTQSATFTVTVTDKVTSSTAVKSVAKALYPLDLYDNGSGVVGVGLGVTAVANYVITPLSLKIDNAKSTGGYVNIFEDGEGGNIAIGSPSGKEFQIDAYNDTTLRFYGFDDSNNYHDFNFNRNNGQLTCGGGFYGNATSSTTSNSLTPTQLTSENLNDIVPANTTWYYASGSNTVTNTPFASGTAFGLFVYRNAGGYRVQDIVSLNGDKWVRHYNSNSSSWSDWKMIPLERVIWTGTAMADTGSPLSLSTSGYKRVRVYFNSYSTQGTFEIDLEHTTTQVKYTGWPYRGSGSVTPINQANTALQIHFCDCRISTNKDSFYVDKMGYCVVGNATVNFATNSPNYYVYKIVGIM